MSESAASEAPKRKRAQKEKASPLVVRLPEESRGELKALGEKFGLSEAQLVRWAVEGMIEKVDRDGGLQLPFSFDESK